LHGLFLSAVLAISRFDEAGGNSWSSPPAVFFFLFFFYRVETLVSRYMKVLVTPQLPPNSDCSTPSSIGFPLSVGPFFPEGAHLGGFKQ